MLQDKGHSLALHYRGAPRLAAYAHRLMHSIQVEVGGAYVVQRGKRIVELRPASIDKGLAVMELMRESPFSGRTPVFVGDDVTDEYAFAAVNQLGGHSVKVGQGTTAARWRLRDIGELMTWLRRTG
jgi:trehalose 6-phosphate phosphatase